MTRNKTESGQSIVIIAIAFLALVAMAALIIDGGSLYVNRRNAQTAADAAALAGAHEKCVNKGNLTAIQNVVNQYAIAENGATAVESVTVDVSGAVVVQTRVDTPSFFASIFGYSTDTVRATATAGCFKPGSAKNLLPISWACQPPIGGTPGSSCSIQSIPWQLFKDQILPAYKNGLHENGAQLLDQGNGLTKESYVDGIGGKMPYLIMDSSTQTTIICAPPFGSGTVNCDWNGDGIPELSGGGDRGWLALDGSGAKSLSDLIVNGLSSSLTLPQWFPTKSGASSSVFNQAKGQIEDKIVLVPVYNAFCLSITSTTLPANCVAQGYKSTDQVAPGSGSSTFYRVAGFAPFVVTCISSKPNEKCPAKSYAGLVGNPLKNILTIEGYFVSGITEDDMKIDTNGFDLGVYVISLTK